MTEFPLTPPRGGPIIPLPAAGTPPARHTGDETMARQTYTFTEAPDYTAATYYAGTAAVTLDEWAGKSFAEFAAGMTGRGFNYRREEVTLTRGKFVDHTWEK
jgi:hypothetical protein